MKNPLKRLKKLQIKHEENRGKKKTGTGNFPISNKLPKKKNIWSKKMCNTLKKKKKEDKEWLSSISNKEVA